ncbi:MAG TPA: sigma-70 family RNA polymerase sigma factor [Thermoanaerobaculia bacterium]|nr:sigma-70 family RNA polymerase sigma factor [Thermoanaerobaculia bacterium]
MTTTALSVAAFEPSRLLARAAAGDEAAFAALVRRHEAMVYGLAWNALGDPALAEEVAQEVFLRLYRRLAGIGSEEHLVHWLRRVTGQRVVDAVRRRRPALPLDAVPEPVQEPVREPGAAEPLLARRLRRLVGALPAEQRVALLLRYQEEMAPREIAATLGLPVNTVKSRLQRALASLRGELAARTPEKQP